MKHAIHTLLLVALLPNTAVYAQLRMVKVGPVKASVKEPLFHDSHFHLTNHVQEGISAQFYVDSIMGDKVGRSTLFGIPLQQHWSHRMTGDAAPTYHWESAAPLYYYSFTDAFIAMQYRALKPKQQARLDPMITGFDPSDMYAADHIRRVLETFPGVFTGIGEFSIHKEFVSSNVSGEVTGLNDPALDRLLDFCAEAGLVVILHNGIDDPFPEPGKANYLDRMKALVKRHPNTTIIWAHFGSARIIRPTDQQAAMIEATLQDPAMNNLYFDISWDQVAKYVVASDTSLARTVKLIESHPDRVLFGTDNMVPASQEKHLSLYHMYEPLWKALKPQTSRMVRLGNYERLFDAAREKVRAWEKANVGKPRRTPEPTPSPGNRKD